MHLDDGAVQRDRFDLDAHDLSMLQLLEHPIQHAQLGPAVHAGVDRVPVAEALGQAAPLAAVLGNVQDRIQNLQIGQADIASLSRQTSLDLFVLGWCDLHARLVAEK
jgi:hypothetical protein